ncbi:MAG: hypothetical protein HQL13_00505 [Candidatus Omnitrophica bacterium]|nr:hypothetical protein [Candidatus Omnitrophota bacterium]
MKKNKTGFMLLEALLSVVIVSVSLTLIAESLLTNLKTTERFQEMTTAFMGLENRLGLLYATNASPEDFNQYPKDLGKPFGSMTSLSRTENINDNLKTVDLEINWPSGKHKAGLDITTMVYIPDEK